MDVLLLLEKQFGVKIAPFGHGSEARTFLGGNLVFKVFDQKQANSALREARSMTRAGLGNWVHKYMLLEGYGVLVTRYFSGEVVSTLPTDAQMAYLGDFFSELHRIKEPGETNRDVLEYRLELFQDWLSDIPLAITLVKNMVARLDELVGVPLSFCHKDPHAGNILLQSGGGDIPALVVDWARAAGEDPARDLAILKTGTLDQFGEQQARRLLRVALLRHHNYQAIASRLGLWVPLTYLHDLYWYKRNQPQHFAEALADKLPRAAQYYQDALDRKSVFL